MTRKDYKLIAEILREIPDTKTRFKVANFAKLKLAETNPAFNPHKFMDACIM